VLFWQHSYKHILSLSLCRLQSSLHELVVSENDPGPARLILYSNLPITCQAVTRTNSPYNCWITFDIKSTEDIAIRQRLPAVTTKNLCTYRLHERDWKPSEGLAYDNDTSLDIVAKVDLLI